MQQRTKDWLEVRRKHIGASEAPIIMGVSPWKTPVELWEEKQQMVKDTPINPAMKRGIEMEPVARAAYIKYTSINMEPHVLFHPTNKWMMASLDGISENGEHVVEIKVAGKADHEEAKYKRIPKKYYPQLQHQMEVAGITSMHYFSWNEKSFHLVEVEKDEEYIKNMCEKEKKFWDSLFSFEPPEPRYLYRDDLSWEYAAEEWKRCKAALHEAKKNEEIAKNTLIDLSQHKNSEGAGIRVQKIIRRGNVDYASIPQLQDIDIEKYRKNPSVQWRLANI